jgi:hypothetical protein
MTIVTADQVLQNLIAGLKEKAEVRDAEGNLLGFLTPREIEEELLYEHAAQIFDPTEIKRQLEEQKAGDPIERVLDRLRAVEKP